MFLGDRRHCSRFDVPRNHRTIARTGSYEFSVGTKSAASLIVSNPKYISPEKQKKIDMQKRTTDSFSRLNLLEYSHDRVLTKINQFESVILRTTQQHCFIQRHVERCNATSHRYLALSLGTHPASTTCE